MNEPLSELVHHLLWRPLIPPGAIAAASLVLIALAIAAYWGAMRQTPVRAAAFLVMRIAAVAALAVLLMGPSALSETPTAPQRSRLTVMLDTSASMLTPDAGDQTRIGYVLDQWLGPEQVRRLTSQFDVDLIGFDDAARVLGAAALREAPDKLATGRASRYERCLTDLLLQAPPGGGGAELLVIGDGHDTDDASLEPVVALARSRRIAVHSLCVGGKSLSKDVAVTALPRQDYLMLHESGQVLVQLDQAGLDDATVTLHMTGPGVAAERRISFGGRDRVSVALPIKGEQAGLAEYRVWVDPLPGEAIETNNRQSVFVEVSPRPLKVLVLEGEPNWDTKFIAQALRTDPRIEIASIIQVRADRQQQITSWAAKRSLKVPQTPAEFAEYDVVVLGRGMENVLEAGSAAALEQWVSEGGGHVVFARGRAYDADAPSGQEMGRRLASLEPVTWEVGAIRAGEGVRLRPTAEGNAGPLFSFPGMREDPGAMLAALPGLVEIQPVKDLKPATTVLARGQIRSGAAFVEDPADPPAIVAMANGRGRVMAVLGEGLWRWAMLPPELRNYRGAFESFWSGAIRWLAMGGEFEPGQQVSMKLGRTSVRLGDPLTVDVVTRFAPPAGFAPTLRVIDPDGQQQRLSAEATPGTTRRQATFTPTKAGVWRVEMNAAPLEPATLERRFNVYNADVERLRTDARPQEMRELSQRTGGVSFDAMSPVDLAGELHRQQLAQRVPPRPHDVWDRGIFLAVLLGWIGLEWIGRRRAGWV